MKKIIPLLLLFILLTSHELFLKTTTYYLQEYTDAELFLYNGTFDTSENPITRDRIIKAQIKGPEYHFYPRENDYYDADNVTYLKFRTAGQGTYVAGISTLPRNIDLTSDEFREYLEHEGLKEVMLERERDGIADQPATEKYSKHVKAILQVGDVRTDDYDVVLGYPTEFIPLSNPYKLSVGDTMSFRLFYNGKPLTDQVVHYSFRTDPTSKEGSETETRTDANGEVSFKITNTGQWYVATIHMMESKEEGIDYESNWATLTFEIR